MSYDVNASIQFLKSVGPKRAEAFRKINIFTVRDLLFYLPLRYLDRTNILSSNGAVKVVREGYEGEVTLIGKVLEKEIHRYGRKQILKVMFRDEDGSFECVWFHGIKFFQNHFGAGDYYALSAKPVITKYGHLQLTHPDFDKMTERESDEFLHTGKIIPFYSLPKELRSKNIGELGIRRIVNFAVENYAESLHETLPEKLISEFELLGIKETIRELHFPSNYASLEKAKRRIKFEELFYLELLVALRKRRIKKEDKPHRIKTNSGLIKNFIGKLPFELTDSQLRCLHEIRLDLERCKPMNRLLQGDVGSGKTVIALIAILIAVDNGLQTVLMVPTEILANQHFHKINELLADFGIESCLVIGGQKKKEREEVLRKIKSGTAKIIVGTHALFEDRVEFKNLGLVVIDEQHRFGVIQRSRLINKGFNPDLLIMTATPIPRTLTMTLYGDLDVSINDSTPKNRKEIITTIRGESSLPKIYKFIVDKAAEGYQSFIIYPLVEESDKLDLKDAVTYYEKLSRTFLSSLKVGLIHGKMKWYEKDEMMRKFAAKEFDALISTTVIEVGIDIPDANIILINDAFRFGLSQLHQLRGRVGRGDKQAYCILMTSDLMYGRKTAHLNNIEYLAPAVIEKQKALIRLNSMARTSDGFKLSEIDLKLRGPGDIFGINQSGFPELKYADIIADADIIEIAKTAAFDLIDDDPILSAPEHSIVKFVLKNYYKDKLSYANTP